MNTNYRETFKVKNINKHYTFCVCYTGDWEYHQKSWSFLVLEGEYTLEEAGGMIDILRYKHQQFTAN